jgi:glucose-specific phosphotransferase system IIA component
MLEAIIFSPFTGVVIPIEKVPDPVFAEKMLGDGVAVNPTEGNVLAPLDGTITILHSSGHAFTVQAENSPVTVLVHVGLDTVKLKGQGFILHAKVGDKVKVGQLVLSVDLKVVSDAGYSAISPVILPDLPEQALIEKNETTQVIAGSSILYKVTIP